MQKSALFLILSVCFVLFCGRPETPDNIHNYRLMDVCSLPGYAVDIDIKSDYAYIANEQGGLQIVNISNPESLYIAGSYISEKSVVGVAVRDTFAYLAIAHSQGGLRILNISRLDQIIFVGEDNWYYAYDVVAPGSDTAFTYMAGGYWFVVEDVRYPQYPSFVRRFSTPGNAHGIWVGESLVYIACEQMGVHIFDLSNPDSTALISWIDTPSNARNLWVDGEYLYVADGRSGLVVIDISSPDNPQTVSVFDTPDYANAVMVNSGLAYIADGAGGLIVIDVTDPASPELCGEYDTPYANSVFIQDSIIWVADRDQGLLAIIEEQE
ncbi:hypothetical protein A2Y85_02385 [candidate division WOR-3 bacterium RBG_13_43_14]|uniref:LVIVD repeat protein n=1 Tax=candidate division WOR-3 bacterium RBG_13_43_14 TaxID=1802590 RepID=A0A1F4UDR0_UNCW3|nr:MAG: hypothetical protein A2Y85_02385 [candidate division WOR-3 bacterium RBG_13_43_14]